MPTPGSTGLLRQFLTLALAAAALLVPASAASAHDVLTGTNPEAGQTVQDMPDALELTFSNRPLALGSAMTVEDADGQNWAAGDVEIIDNTVSQPINSNAPAGTYTVTWRVVSSDSHPIEGTFEFTAAAGGQGGPPAAPAAQNPSEAQTAQAAYPMAPVAGIAAILAVLVIITAVIVRRKLNRNRPA